MKRSTRLLAAPLALALVVAACGSDDDESGETSTDAEEEATEEAAEEEVEHVRPSEPKVPTRRSEMRNLSTVRPVVNRLQVDLAEACNLRRREEIPGLSDARDHLNWVAAEV